jgi:hypothetical protein
MITHVVGRRSTSVTVRVCRKDSLPGVLLVGDMDLNQ